VKRIASAAKTSQAARSQVRRRRNPQARSIERLTLVSPVCFIAAHVALHVAVWRIQLPNGDESFWMIYDRQTPPYYERGHPDNRHCEQMRVFDAVFGHQNNDISSRSSKFTKKPRTIYFSQPNKSSAARRRSAKPNIQRLFARIDREPH